MKTVAELVIGVGSVQIDEKQWGAIIGEEGPPPPPPDKANLYGFVHDTGGNPLAAVSVVLNEHETATMLDGTFRFLNIEPNTYTIICEKGGYQSYSKQIILAEGDNGVDITMLAEGEEKPFPWQWLLLSFS